MYYLAESDGPERRADESGVEGAMGSSELVGPGFWSTIGVPLLSGRECTARDTPDSPRVAVVSRAFAQRFFSGANPVGKRFGLGEKGRGHTHEIVGWVPNAAYGSLRTTGGFAIFRCMSHYGFESFTMRVRASGDPAGLFPSIRGVVREMDKGMPILELRTVEMARAENLGGERAFAFVMAAVGALALRAMSVDPMQAPL